MSRPHERTRRAAYSGRRREMPARQLTVRQMLDRSMSEDELLAFVTEMAETLGWAWIHIRPARTLAGWRTPISGPLGKGWPDLVLAREADRRMVIAELKSEDGKVEPEQAAILEILRAVATPDVFVWRPSDWSSGEITTVLE